MSAKHAAGPWWVTASGVRNRGGYICHTNPAQRYEGQDARFAEETAERAANKLLIAAAPELLAACIVAFDQTCSVGRPKDWEQLRDAIEFATGSGRGEVA